MIQSNRQKFDQKTESFMLVLFKPNSVEALKKLLTLIAKTKHKDLTKVTHLFLNLSSSWMFITMEIILFYCMKKKN